MRWRSRNLGRKLVRRAAYWRKTAFKAVLALCSRSRFETPSKQATEKAIARLIAQRCTSKAQWSRWYQANRRRQRQMAAMRRQHYGARGMRIHPNSTGLPRWVVR